MDTIDLQFYKEYNLQLEHILNLPWLQHKDGEIYGIVGEQAKMK